MVTGFGCDGDRMTNHTATTTAPLSRTGGPFPDDDPRAVFARAVALAGAVIDAVPATALHEPTPCAMDVRDLQEHLVMVLRRVACAGRGEEPSQWPMGAPDVADDGFGAAWRAAGHEVQAAWTDDALLGRPTALPWGTFSGADVLGVYTNEIVVHTWDLAQATGQRPEWDPSVLAVADAAIRAQLPMADRTQMWAEAKASLPLPPGVEWEDPFANAVDVPDDAPAIDRLVAWNGRQP
jgi:uncharacterized protein (TIGR03086 family)